MPKAEREFFSVGNVEWTPAQGGLVAGLWERILATDSESGVATRMLRFDVAFLDNWTKPRAVSSMDRARAF